MSPSTITRRNKKPSGGSGGWEEALYQVLGRVLPFFIAAPYLMMFFVYLEAFWVAILAVNLVLAFLVARNDPDPKQELSVLFRNTPFLMYAAGEDRELPETLRHGWRISVSWGSAFLLVLCPFAVVDDFSIGFLEGYHPWITLAVFGLASVALVIARIEISRAPGKKGR